MDRDHVGKFFSQIFDARANRLSVFLLFRRQAEKPIAKLRIMHSFGMLAVAHGMLFFSDIAMT